MISIRSNVSGILIVVLVLSVLLGACTNPEPASSAPRIELISEPISVTGPRG